MSQMSRLGDPAMDNLHRELAPAGVHEVTACLRTSQPIIELTVPFALSRQAIDHGYPVKDHLARLVNGPILQASALDGAFVLSTRGGDFELHLAQDLSIGYQSHDADAVRLYFREALTFQVHTPGACIRLARQEGA